MNSRRRGVTRDKNRAVDTDVEYSYDQKADAVEAEDGKKVVFPTVLDLKGQADGHLAVATHAKDGKNGDGGGHKPTNAHQHHRVSHFHSSFWIHGVDNGKISFDGNQGQREDRKLAWKHR